MCMHLYPCKIMCACVRMLETKERKMVDINKNTGQVHIVRSNQHSACAGCAYPNSTFLSTCFVLSLLPSTQVPALRQQYDRVLAELQNELKHTKQKEFQYMHACMLTHCHF